MSDRPDPRVGVFDTLLVQAGVPIALDAHLRRLAASVSELYAEILDVTSVAQQVRAAAASSPLQRIRVDVAPGGQVRIEARPLRARPSGPLTLAVRRVPGGWGGHKWRDRTLLECGVDPADQTSDLLLVDEDDAVLESARGNVFVVPAESEREVLTPALDGRILPGVTRASVLAVLPGLEVTVSARPVALVELAAAAEVFVTGSIGGVRPVTGLTGVAAWAPGPIAAAVGAAVERAWERPA